MSGDFISLSSIPMILTPYLRCLTRHWTDPHISMFLINVPTCNSWVRFRSVGPVADRGELGWRAMSPQCQQVVCWSHEGCRCRTRPGLRWGQQGGTCWHVRRRSLRMMSHCSAAAAAALNSLNRQRRTLQLKSLYICILYITYTWCNL